MLQRIIRLIKIFLFKIDLFSSPQLLRYKKQTNYSTLTGGFLSLTIIIIFGTLLIQNSIAVITKSNVIALDATYFSEDPTYTTFNFDDSSPFIIGIGITNLNLNQNYRYFDVILSTQSFSYGNFSKETTHTLQPCEYDQWAHVNKIGANSFKNTGLSNFLCPAKNVTVELQGKFTSEHFKFLKLKIAKCKNQTDPSRPCVDPSIVNQTGTYQLNYYFMNAYVNSGDQFPVNYYLEDRNYFGFTLNSTIAANIYLTQQVISTDDSLLPWSSEDNQTVLLVNQLAEVKTSQAAKDVYISIYLRKSPYFKLSTRGFQKLEDLFSAIGGLFGFAVTFFLFIQNYTQASYQIEMGDNLFYYHSQDPLQSKNFNFFYYIILCIYEFLQNFSIQIPWKKMKMYFQCRQEVVQQLDLSLLMNKTTFLEKCMNILFEEHQFRAIYLQQKPNVKEAQNLRRNHGLNKIIHNHSKKINNDLVRGQIKRQKKKIIKTMLDIPKTDSIIVERISKQSQPSIQKKMSSIQIPSQDKIPYDLMQVMANFIMKNPNKQKQRSIKDNSEEDDKKNDKAKDIQLEQVAEENMQSCKFINTALNDIRKVEEQSKRGNVISKRIYNQLNNDITKEQFIVLKCLENIMTRKSIEEQHNEPQGKNWPFFENILNLAKVNEEELKGGLQIVLESNNRIQTNHDL